MKKLKIILLAISFIVIASQAFAQSTLNSYTASATFNNNDSRQIYQAIRITAGQSQTAVITGTPTFQDNTSDTLNKRLGSIRTSLYSSGVSLADWIVSVDSKLNSIVNQNSVRELQLDSLVDKGGIYQTVIEFTTASSSGTFPVNGVVTSTGQTTSFSIQLPSGEWDLTETIVMHNNNGINWGLYFYSASVSTGTIGQAFAPSTNSEKIIGYWTHVVSSFGYGTWAWQVGYCNNNASVSRHMLCTDLTNNVLYMAMATMGATSIGANQQFKVKLKFQRVK